MEFKSIEITFEYQEKLVTLKSEPYKKIKEIKERAIKRFHNIPKDIHCYYIGRDLESYENKNVGDFFSNREKVTLKLIPRKKQTFPNIRTNNKNEEIFSDIYLNTNVFSSGFNNIGRFENKKIEESYSIESNETRNKNKRNKELKLPLIKKNKSIERKENNYNNGYDLETDIFDDENKKCQNCGNNDFSEYCRNCKEFLCTVCKKKDEHQNHLFIHLGTNYEANIRIYGNILLTDIEHFKSTNNTNNKNDKSNINSQSLFNIDEINTKHNSLINKLKDILNMYESIINEIKNEFIIVGENKIKDFISIYNNNSLKINEEITKILKQLETHKLKINLKEFKNYYEEMSEKEEKLNAINKNIIKYNLTSQINNKIVTMLNKIEQVLNETIKDNNNPFNLAPKFNDELSLILDKNKRKKTDKRSFKKSNTSRIRTNIKEENIKENE